MKFSVKVDPDLLAAIDERAAAADVRRTDWVRAELWKAVNPQGSRDTTEIQTMQAALADIARDRNRLAARVAELESQDRTKTVPTDSLTDRPGPEGIREELALALSRATTAETRVAVIEAEARKDAERIADLRRALSTLEGQLAVMTTLANRGIPEKTGQGRRPWWKFWGRAR
jgi:chaperonin cofactor prefoldin